MLFTLIAVAVAILGFFGGSLWIFTAAAGFLILKMYPLLMVLAVLTGVAVLYLRHCYRG